MGTLTITTTTQQDTLIVAAFGKRLGLSGNASAAQVKTEVINFIKRVVENYEREQDAAAFTPTGVEPS